MFVFVHVSITGSAFMLDLCIRSALGLYIHRNAGMHTLAQRGGGGWEFGCLRGQ